MSNGTFALMSSFDPVVAWLLWEQRSKIHLRQDAVFWIFWMIRPVVEEITGKEEVDFHGAEVKNVTFAYGEETILEDVSVTIPENKIIGINGRPESGKSTLLKLLMRFWQVRQGAVKVSGRNVEEIIRRICAIWKVL